MIRPAHTVATLVLLAGTAWAQQTPAPAGTQTKRYDGHKLVRADLETREDAKIMRDLKARRLSCHEHVGPTDYVVAPELLLEMRARGIEFEVLDDDVQASIEAESARIEIATMNAAAGIGSWYDDYKDRGAIEQRMLELQAARPDLVTLQDIGDSIEGRDIWAMTITGPGGGNKPAALFTGTLHAREWLSPMMNVYLAEHLVSNYDTDPQVRAIVDKAEILIVPIVNPDGYDHTWLPDEQGGDRFWRKNRRAIEANTYGVDLNRNWDAHWGMDDIGSSGDPDSLVYRGTDPFSEPETTVVRDLILAHPSLVAHIDYHAYSQMILTPYGYTDELPADHDLFMTLATMMEREIEDVHFMDYVSGPGYTTIYPVNGEFSDWCYDERGFFSCTVELRPGPDCFGCFDLEPQQIISTCEENLEGALALIAWTTDPVTWVFPQGVVPQIEADATTAIPVQIVAAPGAIVSGSERLVYREGLSGPFTEVPLTFLGVFDYEATLPPMGAGATMQFYLAVDTTDGQTLTSPANAPLQLYRAGVVEPVYAWPFDEDPNWTTEGDWAFGQPTGSGGYSTSVATAHPDPASGHSGLNVYGNNLDGDSVPSGPVSLTSEPIDCSGLRNVQLRFWRWLNVGTSPDWATVEASNDGTTWRNVWAGPVEENAWTQVVLDLSEIADDEPTVYVRWTLNAHHQYTGWNLDDVEIWATPVACPGDLNFDGSVGFTDLTNLLAAWGPCATCVQDIDNDGVVGFTDLTELLSSWGPCG